MPLEYLHNGQACWLFHMHKQQFRLPADEDRDSDEGTVLSCVPRKSLDSLSAVLTMHVLGKVRAEAIF